MDNARAPAVGPVPMVISDLPEVRSLWQVTEHVGLDESDDTTEALAQYLERNPGLSFVARVGGHLVGAVLCGTDGRRGYLNHLAVAPSHRRQGIGRLLVRACLDALRSIGITRCNSWVYGENAGGLAFWKALGWQFWSDKEVIAIRYVPPAEPSSG
jgi:ribosomal protein S18 acetylase RimI-like enzyme